MLYYTTVLLSQHKVGGYGGLICADILVGRNLRHKFKKSTDTPEQILKTNYRHVKIR